VKDLRFDVHLTWQGPRGSRRGTLETGGQAISWSVPASMGGLGTGTSPEELLLGAVGSCYSATLGGVLRQRGLPASNVRTRVEGTVTGYPEATRFAEIRVHPTIDRGDPGRTAEYREAALAARDRCFIGSLVRPKVAYEVGSVAVEGDPSPG
jgi:peroxiredoxin-like protein